MQGVSEVDSTILGTCFVYKNNENCPYKHKFWDALLWMWMKKNVGESNCGLILDTKQACIVVGKWRGLRKTT